MKRPGSPTSLMSDRNSPSLESMNSLQALGNSVDSLDRSHLSAQNQTYKDTSFNSLYRPRTSSPPSLSSANRHWWDSTSRNDFPQSFTSTHPSFTKDLLEAKIGNLKRSIKVLYERYGNEANRAHADEIRDLKNKIKDYKIMLDSVKKQDSSHLPLFPNPKKVPFSSSNRRLFQETKKHSDDDPPNFFRGEKEWMFGTDKMSHSLTMNAYHYTDNLHDDIITETTCRPEVLVGISRPQSRCRMTDFYGPQANALLKHRLNLTEGTNSSVRTATYKR